MKASKSIEVEVGPDYAGLYSFTHEQIFTAAAFMAAVVRRLEGAATATVGLRDLLSGPQFDDLERLGPDDPDGIARCEIQDGAILLDGRRMEYRVKTERAGSVVLYLYVPGARQAALFDALAAEVGAFRARGHELSMPALETGRR